MAEIVMTSGVFKRVIMPYAILVMSGQEDVLSPNPPPVYANER